MNYLVYVSTSVEPLSNEDLTQLLLKSRINNSKAGITGMLLYNSGTFFQVLEGEEQELNSLFERVKHDSRHKGIIKLKSGNIPERHFPDWSMGFRTTITDSIAYLFAD